MGSPERVPANSDPGLGGRIFAAVLTYNRRELLADCLDAIARQTSPPCAVVVLDNGSEDDTTAFLRDIAGEIPVRFYCVRLNRNVGPAAGFNALFRYCYDHGADWVWAMDDDVVPAADALEELTRAFTHLFGSAREIGFLISSVVSPDGSPNNVPFVDDRRAPGCCSPWSRFLRHGIVQIRCASFVSILIPRTTMQDFGFPSPEFYAWGEDSDYTMRITRERPAFIVGRSQAMHLRGVAGDLDIFTESDSKRLAWFYYLYRNTTYLRRRYWPAHNFVSFMAKALGHTARCLAVRPRSPRRAWIILSGMVAGLFFHPSMERPGASWAKGEVLIEPRTVDGT